MEGDLLGLAGSEIGSGGGTNIYPYAGNNAFRNVDPRGLNDGDAYEDEDETTLSFLGLLFRALGASAEGGAAAADVATADVAAATEAGATGAAAEAGVTPGAQCTASTPSTALAPYYPYYNGFLGNPVSETLQPGTLIDRYGPPGGSFASPVGTPLYARSLSPQAAGSPLLTYRVVQPLTVQSGIAAPALYQPGGGIQYLLPNSVQTLLDNGLIEPVGQ